jgi:hypothetical protein
VETRGSILCADAHGCRQWPEQAKENPANQARAEKVRTENGAGKLALPGRHPSFAEFADEYLCSVNHGQKRPSTRRAERVILGYWKVHLEGGAHRQDHVRDGQGLPGEAAMPGSEGAHGQYRDGDPLCGALICRRPWDVQNHLSCASDKAKKRIGTYAGDGQVRELQFRPRITPSLKSRIPLNEVAWRGSHVLRQERNEIDRLGDFGLVEGLRSYEE